MTGQVIMPAASRNKDGITRPYCKNRPAGSRRKSKTIHLAAIEMLDREDCIDRWRQIFGVAPPKYTSLEFMRKALAYEAQVKAFGGHSNAVQRALKAALKTVQCENKADAGTAADLVDDAGAQIATHRVQQQSSANVLSTSDGMSAVKHKLKPSILSIKTGTHLVREWNGRTYQVEALDKGFRLDGKTYRSLSAIAKKITGSHWSGPRFFGLES